MVENRASVPVLRWECFKDDFSGGRLLYTVRVSYYLRLLGGLYF